MDINYDISVTVGGEAAFVGLGLFHIGRWIRCLEENDNKIVLDSMIWHYVTLFGAFTFGLIFMNGYINMRTGSYAFIPLFWINATFSIVVGINLSRIVENRSNSSCLLCWVSFFIKYVGKNSITYVCLNQLVILYVSSFVARLNFNIIAAKVIILCTTLVILGVCDYMLRNTMLKFSIGKRESGMY